MKLKLLKLARLLHLLDKEEYKEKRNIEIIKKSKLFNAEWYIKEYPDLKLKKEEAAKHYYSRGWIEGCNPSSDFKTAKYLAQNYDVKQLNICPLIHWEKCGKVEGRAGDLCAVNVFNKYGWCYHLLRKLGRIIYKKQITQNHKAKILVHLHLYYVQAWPEIKEYLDNLACYTYDLIVTYPEENYNKEVIQQIKYYKKSCTIIGLENKGFDIGPFIEVIKDINLRNYDIVYHLHTKSVAKKGRLVYGRIFKGKSWFHQLYSGTLGVFNVHKGINLLLNNKECGIIAAQNLIFTDTSERQRTVCEYAKRLGISVPENYTFVGGSCFGIKSTALEPIKNLDLSIDSFLVSRRYIFTLAHAMERIFSIVVLNQNLRITGLFTAYNNHPISVFFSNKRQNRKQNLILKKLQKYGFSDLKIMKLDIRSGLGCSFVTGKYHGKKVFIKYGGDASIAQNEYLKAQKFKEILGKHAPTIMMYNPEPFVAMELLPGFNLEELVNFTLSTDECQDILKQLEEIKQKLLVSSVLHRDIRPSNFIYTNGELKLLDFQFAVEKTKDDSFIELPFLIKNPRILIGLGDEYRASPDKFDDIISIQKVIDYVKNSKIT